MWNASTLAPDLGHAVLSRLGETATKALAAGCLLSGALYSVIRSMCKREGGRRP